MLPVERVDGIVVEAGLSGVVRVDLDGDVAFEGAYGLAHRGLGVANTIGTQFATASGSKGFTALTVMSLVEQGELSLETTARSLLGTDLPLVDDAVTVEQLLAHRSGIGDYLDEDQVSDGNDYVMTVPVHELATTEQFLAVLVGHPTKFPPGERFSYSNGGYVLLALLAERATGLSFHDLVQDRVCGPAGMIDTAFLRSDELPGRAATGYLEDEGLRTNVFHLPVRASGDGGAFTTAADMHRFWDAVFAGRVLSAESVARMTSPYPGPPPDSLRFGLGFWIEESTDAVSLHGFDAGAGFVSIRDRGGRFALTVLSNQSRGAWPVSQRLHGLLAGTRDVVGGL